MEGPYEASSNGEAAKSNLQIIRYSPFKPCSKFTFTSPWFDLRVFYVRISNFQVDDLTPQFLTLSHIPLSPDTLLEINGSRTSMYSDGIAALLRRDRVDKKSKEATFVSTDSIRTTGSVEFEVLDGKDLVLSGVLEMSNNNGCTGESKNSVKQWRMNCDSHITIGTGFLKGKYNGGPNLPLPTIEVYVTGSFLGTPIILTKTLQLTYHKKPNRKGILDSIPEYETAESTKKTSPDHDLQMLSFCLERSKLHCKVTLKTSCSLHGTPLCLYVNGEASNGSSPMALPSPVLTFLHHNGRIFHSTKNPLCTFYLYSYHLLISPVHFLESLVGSLCFKVCILTLIH